MTERTSSRKLLVNITLERLEISAKHNRQPTRQTKDNLNCGHTRPLTFSTRDDTYISDDVSIEAPCCVQQWDRLVISIGSNCAALYHQFAFYTKWQAASFCCVRKRQFGAEVIHDLGGRWTLINSVFFLTELEIHIDP